MAGSAVRVPGSLQRWDEVTFLHWPVPAAQVQRLLPDRLRADTFDGTAWVSVTPLVMRRVRPALGPTPPGWQRFLETNIRTYVVAPGGRPGLWFLSLECERLTVVAGLRLATGLPYRHARMRREATGDAVVATSRRRGADTHVEVELGGPLPAPSPLDRWLTERYLAFGAPAGVLLAVPVQHPPWRLRGGTARRWSLPIVASWSLPGPDSTPLVHHSPGVDVRVGLPRPV